MTKYWWVNHKQTFRQERQQGYLWSPKREATGARSQFYDNMRIARAGDIVISYADSRVRAIGRVEKEATTAPKPAEFGDVGANWANHGWLLPVAWRSVQHEAKPVQHLNELSNLLPEKYSPINPKSGYGNQKAYLAQVSEDLFRKVLSLTGGTAVEETPACDAGALLALVEELDAQKVYQDMHLSETERLNVIAARWGQGAFRSALLSRDGACAITGVADPRLLRASHIKPWRLCDTAAERLDPDNGLLLTPTFDHLFDKGLMTFRADGSAVFSGMLSPTDLEKLSIAVARAAYPLDRHAHYLAYHGQEIFVP